MEETTHKVSAAQWRPNRKDLNRGNHAGDVYELHLRTCPKYAALIYLFTLPPHHRGYIQSFENQLMFTLGMHHADTHWAAYPANLKAGYRKSGRIFGSTCVFLIMKLTKKPDVQHAFLKS
jgi:hypothetical protein